MSEAHPALHEPWESLGREQRAASFGIWAFLATEVLFFGGLILCYTVYRFDYPDDFRHSAEHAAVIYGTVNTAILLTSSMFMAAGIKAAKEGLRRMALWCWAGTISLGLAFLVVKGFEYLKDIHDGLVPGYDFRLSPPATQLFWGFYWVATSVHALHVTIGLGLVITLWLRSYLRTLPLRASPTPDVIGFYWHFVDIVWIFLYPMIYLVGRASS